MNDPRDWIGIVESAAGQLLGKGYRQCYLILDDHPPLQSCNVLHLNVTLPALMDTLGAAYIGLYGWDQNALSNGEVMNAGYYRLQHQSDSFLWRYSLHPALWNLKALQAITRLLPITDSDLASRSVWAFERRSGVLSSDSLAEWSRKSYRVFGLGMLGERFQLTRRFSRRMMYQIINLLDTIIKKVSGPAAQEKFIEFVAAETLFFDGPYPLYWSGVMQKGRLNANFEKYLTLHRRESELSLFREALRGAPPGSI